MLFECSASFCRRGPGDPKKDLQEARAQGNISGNAKEPSQSRVWEYDPDLAKDNSIQCDPLTGAKLGRVFCWQIKECEGRRHMEKGFVKPRKRLRLKAEFQETLGLSTVGEIASALGYRPTSLYSVFEGWRHPGKGLQESMCKALGVSEKKLEGLL
jgi:hypothetical protein